ncbi:guanine nucleotide-binding protein-like 1 [Spodoptera litura]|uniref:Guanine nucleotide-binding protein-like 1 n=1 Tax=Spodoptera litura TaxID=69820 RepID=A0A9J7ELZ2_SPOLT|nr:guanine nucleotide-binding protein-like 1 [Spodoptera litura]
MPQARRKTPFSGKAKKQQLQSKKQNKTLLMSTSSGTTSYDVVSVNYQPTRGRGGRDTNRYALKFYRETEEELKIKKEEALKELIPVPEKDLEVNPVDYFPADVSFPKRPPWDFNMTPAQLDAQEQRYFKNYIDSLQASEHWKKMSYFELNLETWRQLWRVLEMCDILLLIVDVRYAGMMFPPSLYSYIQAQKKDMILVLNKIDLVPSSVVAGWKQYLTTAYPALRVLYFTSCPAYNLRGVTSDKAGQSNEDFCETILEKADTSFYTHERYKSGVLSIGCVGQPNVGKSSLLNALMGRCVVSVSKTPGHTKHFQTIYLTPQVRLCDCPGLVFPSTVPRPIQILMGSYPIAQLREPYTTIRYLSERLDMPKLLRIEHPEGDDTWSPRDICDGWAKKKGYLTAKAARLDTYRAANSLLRMALDGRICLWLRPPGFAEHRDKYESCEEIKYIRWVQALTSDQEEQKSDVLTSESDDDRHSDDSDADDDSTDDSETAAIANKFAALAGDD